MAAFPWLCQLSSASWNDAVLASASLSVILPSSLSSVSMSFQKRALIGALICIGGNTLISLALNVQKLAHQKTKEQTDHEGEAAPSAQQSNPAGSYEEVEEVDANGEYRIDDSGNNSKQRYTARKSSSAGHSRSRTGSASYGQGGDDSQAEQQADSGPNTRFLKSKLWWLGFGLMVLGECGNFICESGREEPTGAHPLPTGTEDPRRPTSFACLLQQHTALHRPLWSRHWDRSLCSPTSSLLLSLSKNDSQSQICSASRSPLWEQRASLQLRAQMAGEENSKEDQMPCGRLSSRQSLSCMPVSWLG